MVRGAARVAIAAMAATACSFSASYEGTSYRCEREADCPGGLACIEGHCTSDGVAGDGGPADAAPPVACVAGDNHPISNLPGRSARSALAWSGDRGAIVWEQDGTDAGILLVELASDGSATSEPVPVGGAAGTWPSVAADEDGYGVAWAQVVDAVQRMHYRSVADGVPGDVVVLSPQAATGAVPSRFHMFVEGKHALLWQDGSEAGQDEIYYRRVAHDGTAEDAVRVTENIGTSVFPAMAWSGSEWGAVWNDDRDGNFEIYFTRFDVDGSRIDGDVRVTSGPGASYAPAIAWSDDAYVATWWDARSDPAEIYTAAIEVAASSSTVGEDVPLVPGEYGQVALLARAGGHIGIVWHAVPEDVFQPAFAPLGRDGRVAGEAITVSTGAVDIDPESLAFVSTGTGFLIAWSDSRTGDTEVYTALVTCE